MATIYDVARLAAVSSATVSHVINGSRPVTPETRQRVLEAIDTLKYRRDGVARSLRRNRTGTIGLMVSDITNPFFSELVRGVEDAMIRKHGDCNLILSNTDEDAAKESRAVELLLEKRIDGLIFAPAGGNEGQMSELVAQSLPLVMVDRELPEVSADAVLVDNSGAAQRLTEHLLELGHRRIAIMQATLRANSIEDRFHGYMAAMEAAGQPVDADLVVRSASNVEDAMGAAQALLALDPAERPTAVFCTNNFLTLGVLRAISQTGLTCPDDVAVAGFDDLPWALGFHPLLTAVSQPARQMGQVAVDLLFERINGGSDQPPVRRVLGTELIIRESCGSKLSGLAPRAPNTSRQA